MLRIQNRKLLLYITLLDSFIAIFLMPHLVMGNRTTVEKELHLPSEEMNLHLHSIYWSLEILNKTPDLTSFPVNPRIESLCKTT